MNTKILALVSALAVLLGGVVVSAGPGQAQAIKIGIAPSPNGYLMANEPTQTPVNQNGEDGEGWAVLDPAYTWTRTPVNQNREGWAVLDPANGARFEPCATLTWSYDPKGQPASARTFKKDIDEGLRMLENQTGLKFVETPVTENANIRYLWRDIADAGAGRAFVGGDNDGEIAFKPNDWASDETAGFGFWKRYDVKKLKNGTVVWSAGNGRGWLIVHETMHILGMDHVSNKKSIMYPAQTDKQKGFTAGDLAGLRTLYPKSC